MITRRGFVTGALSAGLTAGAWGSVGCATLPAEDVDAAAEAKPKHPLTGLTDLLGAPVTPPKILGAVTIVDFWASWCGPCRQSFRYMDQLFRTYSGAGLDMIGISVDDDVVAARRFWAASRTRFPVAWDAGGEVRERFGVLSLPTTILFDAEGMLVQRNEGFDLVDHRLLEEHVHRLLKS